MLQNGQPTTADAWPRLAEYLEDEASEGDIAAICGKLTAERIQVLCGADPDSAKRIGLVFSEWVSNADRVETFFVNGDLEIKVECLITLLKLGTSRNRLYVERKFAGLCGSDMDENLAKRLIIKFHIEGKKSVCTSIKHLEESIDFDRSNFHERLAKALVDFCA